MQAVDLDCKFRLILIFEVHERKSQLLQFEVPKSYFGK
jgi:hypothetical protein